MQLFEKAGGSREARRSRRLGAAAEGLRYFALQNSRVLRAMEADLPSLAYRAHSRPRESTYHPPQNPALRMLNA